MSLFGWFKSAAIKVSHVFVAIFGSDAAKKFGEAAYAMLQTELGKIVQDAVVATASLKLGAGEDARKAAFTQVVTQAKSSGISVSTSLVNLLIEMAVQKIKGVTLP